MTPLMHRLLALWIWLLCAALCLLFLPLARSAAILLFVFVTLIISIVMLKLARRRIQLTHDCWEGLPDATFSQPVVLCCGPSGLCDEEPVRILPQGCFVRVKDSSNLQQGVRQLLQLRPDWGNQLSICLNITPQHQHDNVALKNDLFVLRWQIGMLKRETHLSLPLLINVAISGAMTLCSAPLWQFQLAGSCPQVWLDEGSPQNVSEWQQWGGEKAIQQQILFTSLEAWTRVHVLHVLTDAHTDVASVTPAAIMLLLQPGMPGKGSDSLWHAWLLQHTAIRCADISPGTYPELPEFILPLLPQGRGLTPRDRALNVAVHAFAVAAVMALCAVAWNNQSLIRRIAFDLQHFSHIATTDYALKLKAVQVLREDASQLNTYARQGAPLSLNLGLYQGGHLHLPVLRAISEWMPEPGLKPAPQQNLVRLNAMSLFDPGKPDLKTGSTKVLVNTLFNVKARAGWLIVVSGHTDDTGNPALNQRLSLKRAEAVRDWMRDTGDVDESCFAVQGFGQHRPIATNDTAEGRAANRRVEISLLPQADACQSADAIPPSSQDGDGNYEEKE
ncbi:OmpA family protein (plasmid) [Pantoea sp. BJ2]|uniref:OmpA family protein n=1 Tax=Pantoea sp. BJ2 TaxID=3141322 RepID=A0AAU7U3L6_9GAMM